MVVTRIGRGEDRTGGLEYGGVYRRFTRTLTSYPASCSFNTAYLLVEGDSGWWNRGEKGKVLETEKHGVSDCLLPYRGVR